MANYAETPQYEHDCEHCKFLVHIMGYDLYVCPDGDINLKAQKVANIVIRRSSEPSDYSSGFNFSTERSANSSFQQIEEDDKKTAFWILLRREALLRAIVHGYVKPEDDELKGPPTFLIKR